MKYPPGVSLIICTYNGANLLRDTISHINKIITDPGIPWEMIIIDNASTDNSAEVARENWKLDIPLRIISETRKGLIYARYRGIEEARYEFISFIDDDNWVDPSWIQNIYRVFTEYPEVGICGGRNYGVYEGAPPPWISNVESAFAIGEQGKETGDITKTRGHVWGAGMSFRKSAFEDITKAGFQSILTGRKGKDLSAGEDTELSFAFRLCGWKIWYDESLTLKHYIPVSRQSWPYLIKIYQGFGKSHAIFDLYRLVLHNKTYRPLPFYKKIFKDYRAFLKKKWLGKLDTQEGSLEFLRFKMHQAKMQKALQNYNANKAIFATLKSFRDKAQHL